VAVFVAVKKVAARAMEFDLPQRYRSSGLGLFSKQFDQRKGGYHETLHAKCTDQPSQSA